MRPGAGRVKKVAEDDANVAEGVGVNSLKARARQRQDVARSAPKTGLSAMSGGCSCRSCVGETSALRAAVDDGGIADFAFPSGYPVRLHPPQPHGQAGHL